LTAAPLLGAELRLYVKAPFSLSPAYKLINQTGFKSVLELADINHFKTLEISEADFHCALNSPLRASQLPL
jgi:hypothetical protein